MGRKLKILAITASTNGQYKDDTDVLIEGLTDLGHNIERVFVSENKGNLTTNRINYDKIRECDAIWSPYERENIVAREFKKHFNKPLVGHYEWAPPWRTGTENPMEWGVELEELEQYYSNVAFFLEIYRNLIPAYLETDIKTIVDDYSLETIKKIMTQEQVNKLNESDIEIKPYPIDDELLLSQRDDRIEEKYQVLSTARLVNNKRISHVIRALGMLENPPKYVVIGKGPELDKLIELGKKHKVEIEFRGTGQMGGKALAIQESMFSINPWAWLPIGESAVLSKCAITYDHPCARQKLKNLPAFYVPNNNIKELSKAIKYLIDNPEQRVEWGKKANRVLTNNECELYTKKEAAKKLEAILIRASNTPENYTNAKYTQDIKKVLN